MYKTMELLVGKDEYPRKFVVDNMKFAKSITDYIEDELQDLVEETAKLFADKDHPMPDDFGCAFYENVYVDGLRDVIILAAQDVMDCELVWDYPV